MALSRDVLAIDAKAEIERIGAFLRDAVHGRLRRRGVVVGLSGGVDSSVVVALAARALGPERVLGLFLDERDSSPETRPLARLAAEHAGVATLDEDLTPTLDAVGCYRRRDAAIRTAVPAYGEGWAAKLVLPSVTASDAYRIHQVVVRAPDGAETRARLSPSAYLEVVAATSFKQRTRAMLQYHHADRLQYAVAGTPNRLEYDQGFFVKNGDGAADVKPIAHLYKSQVYALAAALGVPAPIRARPPTTDTYPLAQSQEEFYFSLPWAEVDLCLYGRSHGLPPEEVAPAIGRTTVEVERVYRDLDAKRAAATYLHAGPLLLA
jgi:NAD+ synthase